MSLREIFTARLDPTREGLENSTLDTGNAFAGGLGMFEKPFVYIIQSDLDRRQHYVGLTANVGTRLAAHNSGESTHTRKYRPWRLVISLEFDSQAKAAAFEKYLKSGSGAAFMKRHFL